MKIFTEKEAEKFLEKEGFKIIRREFIKKEKDLEKTLKKMKFPLVMKISSKKITHKARIGGVKTNILDKEQAKRAYKQLKSIKGFEEAIVQPKIYGKEFILGLKKTPEFSDVIMFGAGGSKVEKKKDISFRTLPITKKDTIGLLNDIKLYNQSKKKNNINTSLIIKNILKLSKLVKKYKNIEELDINPLIVNKKQAVIVDARIVFNSS